MPTNHGSIEFLKFPNPLYPGDNTRMIKKWLRDSWARRKILALQQAVAAIVVPTASTANPQMDGTAAPGSSTDYARADHVHPHDTSKADVSAIPTKTSDLTNDSGFITSAPVASVNGQTGAVTLDATDVGALPDTTPIPTVPTNVSAFTNDAGYVVGAKFAPISGNLPPNSNSPSTPVTYPDGFTQTNCVAIGFMVQRTQGDWRTGDGVVAASSRVCLILDSTGYSTYCTVSGLYNQPWKAVLMRTDI